MRKLLILIPLLLSSVTVYANPIYTYEETIPISDSITLTKVQSLYSDRNVSYSYIKADLTDENIGFKLLTSDDGTDILDTVSNLAKTEEDVVAALNADFFSYYSGNKGFSLGIEIKDGELLQSPINPGTMATIAYDGSELIMSYLDFHLMAVAPNWQYSEVVHLNKHTSYYGNLLMYTSEFNGGMSPAPGGEVVEVVVSDGKIQEFRRNMPPVKIPEDGCVLVVSEGVNMFLANNFNVGDEIKFDYYYTPDISKVDVAFGGGAFLVKDGAVVSDFSHVVSGKHPRSAIGIDKNGTTLYLVAVNGRTDESAGMTMSNLAEFMLGLGCYNAINLDGGGSTNMVASTAANADLHTVNSPTENRKVINAVGLTYNNESDNEPYGIILKADKDAVFLGDSVNITASVYDRNYRPLNKNVVLTASSGSIDNNVFKALDEGRVTINATCGDVSESIDLNVVNKVEGIVANDYLKLGVGETASLDVKVYDKAGRYVNVTDFSGFEISTEDNSVVSIVDNKITGKMSGNAVVKISKDGAAAYTSVYVGTDASVAEKPYITAPANTYNAADSEQASGDTIKIGALYGERTLIEKFVNKEIVKQLSAAQYKYIIGQDKGFSTFEDANALYINLNTANGGIRNTDSQQWNSLANAIASTNKENVFIMSANSIFGTSDFENRVIKDYLASVNKNVFVVTGGKRNSYSNIDGVKYFTIANIDNEILTFNRVKNYSYLEFKFGPEITFQWKGLL